MGVCGNYVAESLGCRVRKLLNENMLVKNVVIIFIIYFLIGFTNDPKVPPHINMLSTIFIWFFYLILNRTPIQFTGICVFLLMLILITKNYIDYYQAHDEKKNEDKIKFLKKSASYMIYLVIILIVIGFLIYLHLKHKEYEKTFSFKKFIFGNVNCRSFKMNN